ncbi:hypothetical protein [Terasakiella pusilla]
MYELSQTKQDLVDLIADIQDDEVLAAMLEILIRLKELKES